MNLTLILLKSGKLLLSQSEELEYEPKVHLFRPVEVSGKTKVVLTPWPPFSADEHILLHSTDLLTAYQPTEDLVNSYMKKYDLKPEDLQPKENKVLLNEGEMIPDPPNNEDEYEPYYMETD